MRKILVLLAALLACFMLTGCDADKGVQVAKTSMTIAQAGESAVYAVLKAKHDGGTLPDDRWAQIVSFDVKFQATLSTARFALAEYEKLKDKTTAEKFIQLVADLGEIVSQIDELIRSWKGEGAGTIGHYILDHWPDIPADVRRKFLI